MPLMLHVCAIMCYRAAYIHGILQSGNHILKIKLRDPLVLSGNILLTNLGANLKSRGSDCHVRAVAAEVEK